MSPGTPQPPPWPAIVATSSDAPPEKRAWPRRTHAAWILGVVAVVAGQLSYMAIFFGSTLPAIPGLLFGVSAIALAVVDISARKPCSKQRRQVQWVAIALGVLGCIIFLVSLTFV